MKKLSVAFVAIIVFLGVFINFNPIAFAGGGAAPLTIDSGAFVVSGVVHRPGSKTVDIYGSSSRVGSVGGKDACRLRATDNGVSNTWSFDWLNGLGRTAGDEQGTMVCQDYEFCAGQVFITDSDVTAQITYGDLGTDGLTVTNIKTVPTFLTFGGFGVANGKFVASNDVDEIVTVDLVTGVASPFSSCTVAGKINYGMGSPAGGYFYVLSNSGGSSLDLFRQPYNGTSCTGSRTSLNLVGGYGNPNTTSDESSGAVDPLTGDVYYRASTGVPKRLKLTPNCGDKFISGLDEVGGEQCDSTSPWPLNGQSCTSLGLGFTGGTLACNLTTCQFDTSGCTPTTPVCGNSIKEGSEICDGTDFGSKTCATEKGAGWTGSLTCTSCTSIGTSGCVAPPTCGDTTCNGGETCSTCPGDCGVCAPVCGNSVIEAGEVCDASNFGTKSCATEKGAGWTGSLNCNSCTSIGTSGCVAPPPVCGDNTKAGSEACDGTDLSGKSCTTIPGGFTGGTLKCKSDCTAYDTSGCTVPATCGDTSCSSGEDCTSCPGDCGTCAAFCGNNAKEGSEICDGLALSGNTCLTVSGGFSGGTLKCKIDCTGYDTSSCTLPPSCGDGSCNGTESCTTCPSDCGVCPIVCGNNTKEGAEACDGTDLSGKSCTTISGGYTGGTLKCKSNCTAYDTSSCTMPASCGDGTCNSGEDCGSCPGDCGACLPICGDNIKNGTETCDGLDLSGKSCTTVSGGFTGGTLSCKIDCTGYNTSACTLPPSCGDGTCNVTENCSTCPSDCGVCCGNGALNSGEKCDGTLLGGATCASIVGTGYTGSVSCTPSCLYDTTSCIAPLSCGNGTLDAGETCDGTLIASGKTCASEKGEGWTGTLSCSSCMINSSACVAPPWGVKVTSGLCTVSGEQLSPTVMVSGTCDFSLLPKNSTVTSGFQMISATPKSVAITVADSPSGTTTMTLPQGVDVIQTATLGNKMEYSLGAGVVLGTEGTGYKIVWLGMKVAKFTCTDPTVILGTAKPASSAPFPFDVGSGPGKLVKDWNVDIDVLSMTMMAAPYKGEMPDGGVDAGPDAEPDSGPDAGVDSGIDSGSGGDSGVGEDAGNDGGVTPPDATPPQGGDKGGSDSCSCAVPGNVGRTPTFILWALALAVIHRNRRRIKASL